MLWRALRAEGQGLASVRVALAILQCKQEALLCAASAQEAARIVKGFRTAPIGSVGNRERGGHTAEELLAASARFPLEQCDLDEIEKAYFGF